jgi:hypothetical protein
MSFIKWVPLKQTKEMFPRGEGSCSPSLLAPSLLERITFIAIEYNFIITQDGAYPSMEL